MNNNILYDKAKNERNMLDGNINRMFITDDFNEFEKMYEFAKLRIENIYNINRDRFLPFPFIDDGIRYEDTIDN